MNENSLSLRVDTLIADRYKLIHLIATGGMGQVWEATDTRLDRKVAIKVLKPEYSNSPEFLGRFRVEAKITAGLNDPRIAQVFDYGETPDEEVGSGTLAYIVMEYVDGETLGTTISREKKIVQDRTLVILEQTALALQSAHTVGLVHRDVKPGNIMITNNGAVKITDFGIAKLAHTTPITQAGTVMGTAQYISPEQATGEDATSSSDVYALGVVGYECLSGARPFLGETPVAIAMQHINNQPPPLDERIDPEIRNLIGYALSKDPKVRYANGEEFAAAINQVRRGKPAPRPHSWRRLNPTLPNQEELDDLELTAPLIRNADNRARPEQIEHTSTAIFKPKKPTPAPRNPAPPLKNDSKPKLNLKLLLVALIFILLIIAFLVFILKPNKANKTPAPDITSSSITQNKPQTVNPKTTTPTNNKPSSQAPSSTQTSAPKPAYTPPPKPAYTPPPAPKPVYTPPPKPAYTPPPKPAYTPPPAPKPVYTPPPAPQTTPPAAPSSDDTETFSPYPGN